jgi:hypothetical protein
MWGLLLAEYIYISFLFLLHFLSPFFLSPSTSVTAVDVVGAGARATTIAAPVVVALTMAVGVGVLGTVEGTVALADDAYVLEHQNGEFKCLAGAIDPGIPKLRGGRGGRSYDGSGDCKVFVPLADEIKAIAALHIARSSTLMVRSKKSATRRSSGCRMAGESLEPKGKTLNSLRQRCWCI